MLSEGILTESKAGYLAKDNMCSSEKIMLRGFVTITSIILFMLFACHTQAAESGEPHVEKAGPAFSQIFNGRDLTGWDGEPGFWLVKDDVIIAQVNPGIPVKNHSYLIWRGGKVGDFELSLKVRSTMGNSGIDYRADHVPTDRDGQPLKWTIRGYQADIAEGWMGSLYNWGKPGAQPGQFVTVTGEENVAKSVGSVVDKDVLYNSGYYRPKQWNEFTVIARGSHILQRINGFPVVEFIDNSREARRQGLLGLQLHSGRGPFLNEFRDIRIKQFKTNFGQAMTLFNGLDFTGWTFSDDKAKNEWGVEKGLLVNKGGSRGHPSSYICTNDDYTSYVLRFQYRRLGKRKGGVLLRLTGPEKARARCIRIHGEGDDFDQVGPVADFLLEMRKWYRPAVPFRRMPERFWNECEIVLNKGQLEVRVNGVLRATGMGCEQTPGKIAFETSGSRVEYRNMVLIPILPRKAKSDDSKTGR
jgi:hypothetical protein